MDLVTIGYLLHDVLDVEGNVKECLGGSAAYVSIAAKKLGLKSGIVSKVGPDFKHYEQLRDIDLRGISTQSLTTVFYNRYRKGIRKQVVSNVGEKIKPEDIPKDYLKAKAIHLGPVFNEISLETVKFVREKSNALITLDAQGFLRREVHGEVHSKPLEPEILKFVDVIKVSDEEVLDLSPLVENCDIVIITKGMRGSSIYIDKKRADVPTFRTNTIDKTGAGCAYMAGFIKSFLKNKDPIKSAYFASATASFCVEDFGIHGLKNEKVVEKRLKQFKKN